jgi:hypothetical protein
VVVFQNGRMVNDKVEELTLGLEEEQQQSHDDDHRISSAVARGMCSKTYAEKKIACTRGSKIQTMKKITIKRLLSKPQLQ